jgi:hypothetical protein
MASYPQEIIQTEKPQMSRRLPMGFFASAVIFFIIGGALLGSWASTVTNCNTTYDAFGNPNTVCTGGHNGLFYGGVACVIIGAILKFCFWVALIVWCVKRRHASRTIVYVNNPQQQKYGA